MVVEPSHNSAVADMAVMAVGNMPPGAIQCPVPLRLPRGEPIQPAGDRAIDFFLVDPVGRTEVGSVARTSIIAAQVQA